MNNERESWASGEPQPADHAAPDRSPTDHDGSAVTGPGSDTARTAGTTPEASQAATSPAGIAHSAPAVKERKKSGFGHGFGLGAGAALGAGLVAVLLSIPAMFIPLIMMSLVVSGASADAPEGTSSVLYGNAEAEKQLKVFAVDGVILGEDDGSDIFGTGTYGYQLAEEIDGIEADDAEGIILEMNTPGGTIYGSAAISQAIDRYRERTDKPVFAYVRSMSASGGMWAMAGADDIVADHGTMVGSIGVIYGPFSYYEGVTEIDGGLLGSGVTADRIDQSYIASGKGKDLGNPFRPMSEEERNHMQRQVDVNYDDFVQHVSTARDIPQDRIRNDFGAYVFDAQEAVANGLIDAELSEKQAYDRFLEKAGTNADDAKIVQGGTPDFWESLTMGIATRDVLPWVGKEPAPEQRRLYTTGLPADSTATVSHARFCAMGQTALVYHGDASQHCGR